MYIYGIILETPYMSLLITLDVSLSPSTIKRSIEDQDVDA